MTKFETLPPAPEVISELARVRADLYIASVFRSQDGSIATAADFSGAHSAMEAKYVAEMRANEGALTLACPQDPSHTSYCYATGPVLYRTTGVEFTAHHMRVRVSGDSK